MIKLNLIIEYVLSCNSFILFIITLELVEFIVVLLSLLYFGLMYYSHSITAKLKYHFKQLLIFNKILVSNNLSKLSITFFIFLIIVLFNVFYPFILLYIIFWINVLESCVSFIKFVNNKLFKRNDEQKDLDWCNNS